MFMSPEGVKKLEIHLLTCPILPNWRKATSKPGKKVYLLANSRILLFNRFRPGFSKPNKPWACYENKLYSCFPKREYAIIAFSNKSISWLSGAQA